MKKVSIFKVRFIEQLLVKRSFFVIFFCAINGRSFYRFLIFILKHSVLRAFRIIVLAALNGPQKDEPGPDTDKKRQKNEKKYRPHIELFYRISKGFYHGVRIDTAVR